MKNIVWNSLLRVAGAISLVAIITTSCDDKLDMVPKGQSTLSTVEDLEMLLNNTIGLDYPYVDLGIVCNESYGQGENVPLKLTQKNTFDYALITYDESVDRANLRLSDGRYDAAYKYINYMNTLIEIMPDATGDASRKEALIAEAHVMRGYLHWLMVNIYAKQYDAATATTDGGIAYVDNLNITEVKQKESVAAVYEKILEDCSDKYIQALPLHHANVSRGDQAWGNAVRAKVLMQMKRYEEALPYAQKALEINGMIDDRSSVVSNYDWILPRQAASNYVYFQCNLFTETISPETVMLFEEGDYVKDYAFLFGMPPSDDEGDDWDDEDDWDEDEDDWGDVDWADAAAYRAAMRRAHHQLNELGQSVCTKGLDDEDDWDDEEEGDEDWGDDEEDWYIPANVSNPAWNQLFGMLTSGVVGSAQYFAVSAYVNGYGITSDRMYYAAAECLIRTGRIAEGMALINKVRAYRIDEAHFTEWSATTEEEAMVLMQQAKWIECIGTYENFFDCKRWNSEEAYRRTITRMIIDLEGNMNIFSIEPDSKIWIFPFPQNATRKNPTLTQNY